MATTWKDLNCTQNTIIFLHCINRLLYYLLINTDLPNGFKPCQYV
jgi:hypothetical protein